MAPFWCYLPSFRDDVQNVRASKLDFSENQVMRLNSVYFFTESEITFAQCQKALASETPFKRHFAGGPIVACLLCLLKCTVSSPWQSVNTLWVCF